MTLIGHLPVINLLYNNYSENREKRKEYYKRLSEIKSYTHFLKRVNGNNDKNSFNAQVRIKPFGLNFGISKQEVVSKLGKPHYVLAQTGLEDHQVIYYKKKETAYSYILQIHFLNNKMVYAMNRIKGDSALKNDFFINVARMLLSRYSYSSHDDLNVIDSIIYDEFDNKVEITETLGLIIRYISGSKDFIGLLNSKTEVNRSNNEDELKANYGKLFVDINGVSIL